MHGKKTLFHLPVDHGRWQDFESDLLYIYIYDYDIFPMRTYKCYVHTRPRIPQSLLGRVSSSHRVESVQCHDDTHLVWSVLNTTGTLLTLKFGITTWPNIMGFEFELLICLFTRYYDSSTYKCRIHPAGLLDDPIGPCFAFQLVFFTKCLNDVGHGRHPHVSLRVSGHMDEHDTVCVRHNYPHTFGI